MACLHHAIDDSFQRLSCRQRTRASDFQSVPTRFRALGQSFLGMPPAESSSLRGIEPNAAHYVLLVFISIIGSAGAAPVPSAGLVMISIAYNTVFNTTGTPEGFSYILAIEWFMDRLRTTLNVTGDAVISGMVSHLCPMDEEEAVESGLQG
jgi:hypothetical protein